MYLNQRSNRDKHVFVNQFKMRRHFEHHEQVKKISCENADGFICRSTSSRILILLLAIESGIQIQQQCILDYDQHLALVNLFVALKSQFIYQYDLWRKRLVRRNILKPNYSKKQRFFIIIFTYSYLSNKRTCPLILFKKKVQPTL